MDKIDYSSRNIDIARGLNKYPESWSEFKRYIKFRIKYKR